MTAVVTRKCAISLVETTFHALSLVHSAHATTPPHTHITKQDELWEGEDVAPCPSCTLRIRVIYDEEALPPLKKGNGGGAGAGSVAVSVH